MRSANDLGEAATCAIAVMAKASAPGRTKTRLVPPLTFAEAAAFNTAFLQDIAAKMLRAASEARIKPFMAYGPLGSEPFFRAILPRGVGLIEAAFPDFGQCLLHAVETLLDAGHGSACVLNADSPTLPPAFLIEAARVLAQPGDRAVLGPSTDGGYYLLGLKRPHRHFFEDIAWSTEVVAEQTRERAAQIGLPLHILPTWYDVDDAAGLRRVIADLTHMDVAGEPATKPGRAPATAALVRDLSACSDLQERLALRRHQAVAPNDRGVAAGATV